VAAARGPGQGSFTGLRVGAGGWRAPAGGAWHSAVRPWGSLGGASEQALSPARLSDLGGGWLRAERRYADGALSPRPAAVTFQDGEVMGGSALESLLRLAVERCGIVGRPGRPRRGTAFDGARGSRSWVAPAGPVSATTGGTGWRWPWQLLQRGEQPAPEAGRANLPGPGVAWSARGGNGPATRAEVRHNCRPAETGKWWLRRAKRASRAISVSKPMRVETYPGSPAPIGTGAASASSRGRRTPTAVGDPGPTRWAHYFRGRGMLETGRPLHR